MRRLLVVGVCLVLGSTLGLLSTPPAGATVTTLCTGYAGCVRAGMSDAGYGAANRTLYWRMYAGHNCTNYAAYRMVKAGLPNTRPWTGSGNATNWGVAMSSITNSTPARGAIAWWRAGVRPAGSSGHVAYVEKVVSADQIIVSQDSWGGDFSWARVTRASSGWPSGFIHFRDVGTGTPSPVGTPSPSPSPTPAPPPTPTKPTLAPPLLSGTARPGRTLQVQLPQTPPGLAAAVQWLRSGTPVPGATGRSYLVGAADLGSRLRAQVRYAGSGFTTQTARTAATPLVRAPAHVRVSTTPGKRSFTFTATVTGYQGALVDGNLQVRRNGLMLKRVPVQHGLAQGTVTGQPPGAWFYRFRAERTPKTMRAVATVRVTVLR